MQHGPGSRTWSSVVDSAITPQGHLMEAKPPFRVSFSLCKVSPKDERETNEIYIVVNVWQGYMAE